MAGKAGNGVITSYTYIAICWVTLALYPTYYVAKATWDEIFAVHRLEIKDIKKTTARE